MQGDLYQLEEVLRLQARESAPKAPVAAHVAIKHYDDEESPFISVYNEDDVSNYLYHGSAFPTYKQQPAITPALKPVSGDNLVSQSHYLSSIANAFDNYYTDAPSVLNPVRIHLPKLHTTHQVHFSVHEVPEHDDECAIIDDEEDSDFSGPETPTEIRHFHTHHIGSFPDNGLPPMRPDLVKNKDSPKTTATPASAATAATSKVVPASQHVDHIEGAMMSWWPAPVEKLEYEWNEKFYE